MLYQAILKHAEPFALDLAKKPWQVSVRAQVILSFVALALGKGGLFISTFFLAMAWSEAGWTVYAAVSSTLTVLARIEARIDPETDMVELTKRMPFHRTRTTQPLSRYLGVTLSSRPLPDKRIVYTIALTHEDENLSVPLWQRRQPEAPHDICATYAAALKKDNLSLQQSS